MANGTNGQTTAMVHGAAPTGLAAGTTATEGFGTSALARQAELHAATLQAKATASIQARYVMADRRPRDLMLVRQKLLADAMRPGFAEKAIYKKPIGGGKFAEGPSIRFAEAALRAMTNVLVECPVIFDDAERRTILVSITDLEANTTFEQEVTIAKTVERASAEGRHILSSRTNSRGQTTYLVSATEDELLQKQNAAVSRAIRNNGLRVVPGDIAEEAVRQCRSTMSGQTVANPAQARKDLCDAFFDVGVSVEQLADYLGHPVETMTTDEIEELRGVGVGISEGQTNWRDALASKIASRAPDDEKPDAAKSAGERLAAKVADRKGQAAAPPKPAAAPYNEQELYGELDQLEGAQAHDTWRKRVTGDPSWEATPAEARKRIEDAFKAHAKRDREQTGTTL